MPLRSNVNRALMTGAVMAATFAIVRLWSDTSLTTTLTAALAYFVCATIAWIALPRTLARFGLDYAGRENDQRN